MINRFAFESKDPRFPPITLEWDDEADTVTFTVAGKTLPALTLNESVSLYTAMGLLDKKGTDRGTESDVGATEGPRPEQAEPCVPDGGV